MTPEAEDRCRLVGLDPKDPAMAITMPLVSYHDGEPRCIGTAFAVAPGLAITAAHVVYDWANYQERRDGYKRQDAAVAVVAYQFGDGHLFEWQIDAAYACQSSDIAFLRFKRPAWWGAGAGQARPPWARLSFNPPAVGDQVRVCGFPSSRIVDRVLHVVPSTCSARVTRLDLTTRIPLRPLSHFDIEGVIEGGMSGGPCLDTQGNVIGVNSKGWMIEGPPLGHVALLWPAMSTEVDLFQQGGFPAIDLFKEGPTRALGYQRVHVTAGRRTLFARIDPAQLVVSRPSLSLDDLINAMNFAGTGAERGLADIRLLAQNAEDGAVPLVSNDFHRALRQFFWDLDATLSMSLRLATGLLELPDERMPDWDTLVSQWKQKFPDQATHDLLVRLGFSWTSVDLFEVRSYAMSYREGCPIVQTAMVGSATKAIAVEPARRGQGQLFVPDGLDSYVASSRKFVTELLTAARRASGSPGEGKK